MVPRGPVAEDYSMDDSEMKGTCPQSNHGEPISIEMSVGERDLYFTTCHLCEAKWWYRDGEEVPLRSVIGQVVGN